MRRVCINGLNLIAMMSLALVSLCYSMEGNENAGSPMLLSIEETFICRDVVDREPVGISEVFPMDVSRVNCFTRISGADHDIEIIHNWYYEDNLVSSVKLPVRSKNWRTYSSKTIPSGYIGDWKVEILSSDGALLQKIYFLINQS